MNENYEMYSKDKVLDLYTEALAQRAELDDKINRFRQILTADGKVVLPAQRTPKQRIGSGSRRGDTRERVAALVATDRTHSWTPREVAERLGLPDDEVARDNLRGLEKRGMLQKIELTNDAGTAKRVAYRCAVQESQQSLQNLNGAGPA